jgi:hypothetical protein
MLSCRLRLLQSRCKWTRVACLVARRHLENEKATSWAPAPGQKVVGVEREERGWTVSVDGRGHAACPICGTQSSSRHSAYVRCLQDLPAQGTPVTILAQVTRWRYRNDQCGRRIVAERLLELTPLPGAEPPASLGSSGCSATARALLRCLNGWVCQNPSRTHTRVRGARPKSSRRRKPRSAGQRRIAARRSQVAEAPGGGVCPTCHQGNGQQRQREQRGRTTDGARAGERPAAHHGSVGQAAFGSMLPSSPPSRRDLAGKPGGPDSAPAHLI